MAENKAFDSIMKGLSESLEFAKGDASKARQMSELKAFNMPRYAGQFTMHEVYLKSEADKVINELKGTIAQLEDDVAYWKMKYLDLKQKEFKCKN